MEKQAIAETVQKCGEYAYAAGEAAEVTLSLENDNAIRGRQVQWLQAKMLSEIAYQLAVLNERNALADATPVGRVAWCGAVSDDRKHLCGLNQGHEGKHGWEN